MRRAAVAALALLTTAAAPAAADHRIALPASAANSGTTSEQAVQFVAGADDGSSVIFITNERLIAADVDDHQDLYRRRGATLELVSAPEPGVVSEPADAMLPADARTPVTPDAQHIVFQTTETLTAEDEDGGDADLYLRTGDTTRLVTKQSQPFAFITNSGFYLRVRISDDGARVVFQTNDQIAGNDTDTAVDVFEWEDGTTSLLSAPGGGDVNLLDTSADATRVFVETERNLGGDPDGQSDIYRVENGTTTLETPGTADAPTFADASADGSHVFFTTGQSLVAGDTDSEGDVYERAGGETRLVSVGVDPPTGDIAGFQGASADGSHVVFTTLERLDPVNDTDDFEDIYERVDDTETVLVSTGPNTRGIEGDLGHHYAGITPDGETIFFDSFDSFGDDPDVGDDAFMRRAGATTRISVGEVNDAVGSTSGFAGASQDLQRLFFQSDGQLTSDAQNDDLPDLFERAGGHTVLLAPEADEPCPHPSVECVPTWKGNSADGRRAWFTSRERLHPLDGDFETDVYESRVTGEPALDLGATGPLALEEGDPPAALAPALVADDEYDELLGASVAATSGFSPGEDALAIASQDGIEIVTIDDGATIELSGRAPAAAYEAALRSVTFATDDEDPDGEPRTFAITIDNGGHTKTVERTVELTGVPDAPALGLAAPSADPYVEGAPPQPLAPGLTIADPDSDTLAGATATVTEGWRPGEDELGWTDAGGVTATPSADGSSVTFSGAATPAQYEALLRSLTYRNTSDAPDASPRKVTLRADDGAVAGDAVTATIGVTPVNDAPSVAATPGALSLLSGGAAAAVDEALDVADPDSPALARATVRIASGFVPGADALEFRPGEGAGTGAIAASFDGDALTLTGAAPREAYEAALRSVVLRTTSGPGARAVAITVDDGAATATPAIRAVSVGALAPPAPVLVPPRARRGTKAWLALDAPLRPINRYVPVRCVVDAGSVRSCRVTAAVRRGRRLVRVGDGFDTADTPGARSVEVAVRLNRLGLRLLRRQGGALRLHLAARVVRGGGGRALRTSARATVRRSA